MRSGGIDQRGDTVELREVMSVEATEASTSMLYRISHALHRYDYSQKQVNSEGTWQLADTVDESGFIHV